MNKEEIRDYLIENLTMDIYEESFGFNGSHLTVELSIEDQIICKNYINIENDTD